MQSVLAANITKLVHLQSLLESFLILMRVIINSFALGAFQFNHVILRHNLC